MNLLSLYLREFNREYLSTWQDRRRFWANLANGALVLALIVTIGAVLLLWPGPPTADETHRWQLLTERQAPQTVMNHD